jgi:hypothetical protein
MPAPADPERVGLQSSSESKLFALDENRLTVLSANILGRVRGSLLAFCGRSRRWNLAEARFGCGSVVTKPMPAFRLRNHPTFHGANALGVRCRIGVNSGKCRNSTVVMLLLSIQSMPAWV